MSNQSSSETPASPLRGAIFWVAIAFSAYQLWMASFHPLSSQVIRSIHVGFVLLMIFALFPPMDGRSGAWRALGWLLGLAGFATGLYQWVFEADLTLRAGELTQADWVVGVLLIALVFEAARRVMGWGLPLVCVTFLLYALFGQHLPGALAHRGYGIDQVVSTLGFGTEGLYGTPTYVSSTYIFLFILFGAFLEQAGMIGLFNDFAMGTVGHTRGGPAKVSVISSGLMGTINGSGVANVVTTGQFTIPLMKRFGYRAAFAGGVEATSSMGSQIMPPVMGAVAFIMAETINLPYFEVAKAALIPAMLYFGSTFWMVHLEARRSNLVGLPKEQCPSAWGAVKDRWYLLIPLFVLIYLLFSGRTPLFSGTVGLALTAIVILGSAIILRVSSFGLRVVFWIALGLLCAGFFKLGIGVVFAVIAALVASCWFVKGGRATLRLCLHALVEGARHAVPVGIACALVGVIIGVVSLTGAASTFAGYILAIGQENLFLSLVLTMLTCLVLGMGIPTIPNYIITSSIAAPALLELGVPLLVSHMFVFYFGIMADLTPPVALACFAAAPIARERGLLISFWAMRIAMAGFVVPFMAVYDPALMMQGDSWWATLYVLAKALLAIGLWGAVFTGCLQVGLVWWERILAFAAGALLILALPVTDELGFVLAALFIAQHFWRARRAGAATA
ncbi:TRAP transporter, 4TM/12TM fusion protein [compost metagenome]